MSGPAGLPTYSDARDRAVVTVTREGRPTVTARLVSLPSTRAKRRHGRAVVALASGAHISVPVRSIHLAEGTR